MLIEEITAHLASCLEDHLMLHFSNPKFEFGETLREQWKKQVHAAVKQIEDIVVETIDDTIEELHAGKFFDK